MAWEYVKVYTSILDSSIAKQCRVRHVFEDLLKLARPDGVVDMTLDAIARRTGEERSVVEMAIAELCKPDPESRTPDFEGRRLLPLAGRAFGWWIVNHRLYVERGGSTERVRRFRERLAREADAIGAPPIPTPEAPGEAGGNGGNVSPALPERTDTETKTEKDRPPRADRAATRSRTSGQKELLGHFIERWRARYPMSDAEGRPVSPTFRQGDIVAAWKVLAHVPEEERRRIVDAFLADDDPLVVKNAHRLGLLAVRFDALRATTNGIALTPAKKRSAADAEKETIRKAAEAARKGKAKA